MLSLVYSVSYNKICSDSGIIMFDDFFLSDSFKVSLITLLPANKITAPSTVLEKSSSIGFSFETFYNKNAKKNKYIAHIN